MRHKRRSDMKTHVWFFGFLAIVILIFILLGDADAQVGYNVPKSVRELRPAADDTSRFLDNDKTDTARMYHDGTQWVMALGGAKTTLGTDIVRFGDDTDQDNVTVWLVGSTDSVGFRYNTAVDSFQVTHNAGGTWINVGTGGSGTSVEIMESNISKDDPLVILNYMLGFTVTVINDTSYITLDFTENQIILTTEVTGTLPVANGGTGVASLTDWIQDEHIDFSDFTATDLTDFGTMTASTGRILVADGSDFEAVVMSGDATIASGGVLTIAANAIETGMIGADQVTDLDIDFGAGANQVNSDDVPEGSSNFYNQTHTGDVTGSVALTIASGVVTTGMIGNDEILEIDLDFTNEPTDGYIPSYDVGTGGFTWVSQAGGADGQDADSMQGYPITEDNPTDAQMLIFSTSVEPDSIIWRSLSGDMTISNTGVVTIIDDSHFHIISNIDGFSSAQLAGRLDDETGAGYAVFSNAPAFQGQISGDSADFAELKCDSFNLGGVVISATGTELNYVDGVTSAIQTQMDLKAPMASPTFTGTVTIPTPFTLGAISVTSTGTELNLLDGVTSTTAELNILDGVTSTFTELNLLDGVTATTAEINYIDDVTSLIQAQIDGKEDQDYLIDILVQTVPAPSDNMFMQFSDESGTDSFVFIPKTGTGNVVLSSGPTFSGNPIFGGVTYFKNGATSGGAIDFYEDSDHGTNYIRLQAPGSDIPTYTLTLPTDDGDNNQVLGTNGAGVLDWIDPSATDSAAKIDTTYAPFRQAVINLSDSVFGDSSTAIHNLEIYEGLKLFGHFGQMNRGTRIDINGYTPPAFDTFYTLPNATYIDSAGVNDEWMSRFVHPTGLYIPWQTLEPDTFFNQKFQMILCATGFQTGANDENPHIWIVKDIGDMTSPQRFVYASGADTVWIPVTCHPDSFHLDTAYWFSNADPCTTFYDTSGAGQDSAETNGDAGYDATHLSDPFFGYVPGSPFKILMGIRVTWQISGVNMSAIYCATTQDLVKWSAWTKITHLGKWLSPAWTLDIFDSTYKYAMYCPIDTADKISGIDDTTTFFKFASTKWDTIWDYVGPCTTSNDPANFRPWHMSAFPISYDQQVVVVQPRSGSGNRLAESIDQGLNWIYSDSTLWNGGDWYDLQYQSAIVALFDRGGYQSFGLIAGGANTPGGSTHYHIGYVEVPLKGTAVTPGPTDCVIELTRTLGMPDTSEVAILSIPYYENNVPILFIDSFFADAAVDSPKVIHTFTRKTQADSLIFWRIMSEANDIDIDSVYLTVTSQSSPSRPGILDSLVTDTGSFNGSVSWVRINVELSHTFLAGDRLLVKFKTTNTDAGEWVKVDYVTVYGLEYND